MNEIISKVTPLTRGIVWFPQGRPVPESVSYKAVDYLLNGLLTAGLSTNPEASGRVVISSNFGRPLYVFIVEKLVKGEYESFLGLLKKDLGEENTVLVLDETDSFGELQKLTPPELRPRLQSFKWPSTRK